MKKIDVSYIFREKISEGIYHFEIQSEGEQWSVPVAAGYVLVDTKRNKFAILTNKKFNLPKEIEDDLTQAVLEEAKALDEFFK